MKSAAACSNKQATSSQRKSKPESSGGAINTKHHFMKFISKRGGGADAHEKRLKYQHPLHIHKSVSGHHISQPSSGEYNRLPNQEPMPNHGGQMSGSAVGHQPAKRHLSRDKSPDHRENNHISSNNFKMPDIESPPKRPPEIFSMGAPSRNVSPDAGGGAMGGTSDKVLACLPTMEVSKRPSSNSMNRRSGSND